MGGKTKKAERVKDNARPSSSSHCAELLGSNIPVFMDFSTAKDSFFGPSDELNLNVDTNFQIVLKKMTKKDSVTKLKALQEFTCLCKESEAETVKAVLPFWPRLYCSLATDVEHRVREAAHIAHGAVVEKVKKSIAPYLKQLAGPWFTSQYDNYPPAASAATSAFEQAFPSTKLNKAIIFCQEEILNYIYECLIKHTPQTLSNPKITKPEEMDAKYQRIVIASLQGYNLYLQKVSSDQIKETHESHKKIVSSPKFWDYSKNRVPLIRNSFFNVLISLCQNAKFLLMDEMKRVTVAIFNDLDDSDPVVMACVWDAALNALVFLEDCWSHVNFEKQVFPKLNAIIKKGGRNAITIFPSILPLLSKIPCDLLKDKTDFYGVLLQNVRLVLEGTSVVNPSLTDGKTIAATFIECLKYIIVQHNNEIEFCKGLISSHLLPALNKKLSDARSANSSITMAFFHETSRLLRSWRSNPSPNYQNFLKHFWTSLLTVWESMLDVEPSTTALSDILENHVLFLKILQNPNKYVFKPKRKLKFVEDGLPSEEFVENTNGGEDAEEVDPEFKEEMLTFVKGVSAVYLRNSIINESGAYIPVLSTVVNLFDSKVILEEFLKVRSESNLYSLFSNLFCKWVENSALRRGELVDLSFSLLQHVNTEEKELILQTFCKNWFNTDLRYHICRALLNHSKDSSVKSWILSDVFSNHLVELTRNLVNSECDNELSRDIINKFFKARDEYHEPIIGAATASAIMDLVGKSVRSCSQKDHIRQLAQDLIVNVEPKESLCRDAFQELVVALFKLSCYYTDEELNMSCGIGLRSVLGNSGPEFARKLADAIKEIIFSDNLDFCLGNIISRISYFIELSVGANLSSCRCSNTNVERSIGVVKHFVREPPMITAWRKRIEKCCLVGHQSVGEWDLRFVELKERHPDGKSDETPAEYQQSMSKMLEAITSTIGCDPSSMDSRNLTDDLLADILRYYKLFRHANSVTKLRDASFKSSGDIGSEVIVKFAKWNIYVGSVLNLFVSAHPKRYRTFVLKKSWCPYYADKEELVALEERIREEDVVPVKISGEELDGLRRELKTVSDEFAGSEYEERINLVPLCGEVFDFILSVGILISFGVYYAGTKYHQILSKYTNELKRIGAEVLKNANTTENQFCYHSCKYFISEVAKWRMIRPVLEDLFGRRFVDQELTPDAAVVTEFVTGEISQAAVTEPALLKLWFFLHNKCVFHVTEKEWDKIFICLHKWIESLSFEGKNIETELSLASVLARNTMLLMNLFEENHTNPLEKRICPEACLAWNEVVRGELWNQFFLAWQKLAEKWHDKQISPEMLIAIQNMSEVAAANSRESPTLRDKDNVKSAVEYIRYINSPHAVFQITSFQMLLRLVPDLVKIDTDTFCENLSKITEDMKEGSFKTSSGCNWTCKNLEKVISSNQGIVETLLSDFVIGDCCSLEPFTDSFNYTYSYLLIWCFLLEMCGEADFSLRFQYGFWLKERGFANSLLKSIFKLMPQAVIHGTEAKEVCQRYFEKYNPPSPREPVASERIERVACFVYRMFLQRLPNVIREWWSQSENKTSTLVDKMTCLYVSPILIANELRSVHQDDGGSFDNMEIKTHPNAREVVATYVIDEVKMDLVMTLPANYPLGTIKIESSNVVVSSSSRRNWLFHISKYLIHQNGTIWEALVMWKNNLDKKFEGVEECYICASILQGATFETPRVSCQICKKKFHSHCLYKWFSTSNNSSCPICRNLF